MTLSHLLKNLKCFLAKKIYSRWDIFHFRQTLTLYQTNVQTLKKRKREKANLLNDKIWWKIKDEVR
jgi:hypothetical protein